jgi:glycosyltransferase involved in cell wall biosynthesis
MMPHKSPHLLIIVNDTQFFLSHRLPLALAAMTNGLRVTVASPLSGAEHVLAKHGIQHVAWAAKRGATTPWTELAALWTLHGILKTQRPDIIHAITSKPVIYGGWLARWMGIPAISAISGMGYVFINQGVKARLLRWLVSWGYRAALDHDRNHIIVQNQNDADLLRDAKVIRHSNVTLIGGSGVDLKRIAPTPLPEGPTIVALPARMLGDKGVHEFVAAARLLKSTGVAARFELIGSTDPKNPTAISEAQLQRWTDEGVVLWRGHAADMGLALSGVHIVVLPSYREGFPKTVIDAAAAGRVCAVSDVPGCRDAIVDGVTGFLFKPRDAADMARVLAPLIADRALQTKMGQAARRHAEAHFNIADVCKAHVALYRAQLTAA